MIGVKALFENQKVTKIELTQTPHEPNNPTEEILYEYLKGRQTTLSFEVNLKATPFQKKVYEAVRTIPYGETRSYQWVALAIGKPNAQRAVGQALNKNPLPLYIPCHRVIAKNQSLGGFGSGLEVKRYLLDLERRHR